MRCSRWCVLWVLFAATPETLGARLEIPLRVPLEVVSAALSGYLAASSSGAKAGEVYREGPCRHLALEAPKVEAMGQSLKLTSAGTGAIGLEMLGKCQSAGDWRGTVELTLTPLIDPAGVLRVRIVDSKLSDERGGSTAELLWKLGKPQIHARIERFGYDLAASRQALIGLLRSAAPAEQAEAMEAVLRQAEVGPPRVEPAHVIVPVSMEVADTWIASPPPPSAASGAPLTEAELEALEEALAPWDAFLAYAIRQIARDGEDAGLRRRLFTLLLDSRYRLSEILSGDVIANGDPARALFIETFNELRAILAATTRYALFIDAGDALVALESAAPGLRMRLSAEGLRQLARSLRPGEAADPLALDWSVDAEMRQLFEVEEIPDPAPRPRSSLGSFVKVVQGQQKTPDPVEIERWLPKADDLPAYEKRVGATLAAAAAGEVQRAGLAAPHAKTYSDLLPATALIESCWRHYVVRGGKATFLRSQSSSVGIMQINQRVWRGFYDVHRLRWDPDYNIQAGARILVRYVVDYAIPYAEKSGKPGDVPRAAYAVYNAGPRAVGRFAKPTPHPREARVDEKLRVLYEGFAAGGQVDLRTCGVRAPG